jgi:hypothetical protein
VVRKSWWVARRPQSLHVCQLALHCTCTTTLYGTSDGRTDVRYCWFPEHRQCSRDCWTELHTVLPYVLGVQHEPHVDEFQVDKYRT